ncbi:MAG: hypothetical protein M0Q26_01750 [Chitinophagaceae bacterium]|nr:hypothetical protein [Chitinophagaceae bacterium]
MKRALTMLLATGLLLACNSQNEKENSTTAEPATENHEHTEKANGLVLNNGAKWKADSTTLANAAGLQGIVSNAKKESLENYLQTASRLESGLSKMVNECKMNGADHDALHQWLEPLMQKTKELKKATASENAAAVLGDIEKQISLFAQYFE